YVSTVLSPTHASRTPASPAAFPTRRASDPDLTYTVTLKDGAGNPVTADADIVLTITLPDNTTQTVTIAANSSSATYVYTVAADEAGTAHGCPPFTCKTRMANAAGKKERTVG